MLTRSWLSPTATPKIVAKEAVELNGDLRAGPTVGSGPWVLDGTARDDKHEFSPNPYYYEQAFPCSTS